MVWALRCRADTPHAEAAGRRSNDGVGGPAGGSSCQVDAGGDDAWWPQCEACSIAAARAATEGGLTGTEADAAE